MGNQSDAKNRVPLAQKQHNGRQIEQSRTARTIPQARRVPSEQTRRRPDSSREKVPSERSGGQNIRTAQQSNAKQKSVSPTRGTPARRAVRAPSGRPSPQKRRKGGIIRPLRSLARYVILFLIFYVFIALIYCGATLISIKSSNNDSIEMYDAVVELSPKTSTTKAVTLSFSSDTSYRNGKLYLPIDILSNYTKVIEIGDFDSRTFIINGSDTIRCYIGTENAEINGTQSFLKDDILFIDGKIHLSLDFYRDVVTGLNIKFDQDASQYYISHAESETVSLRVKEMTGESSVAYPEELSDDRSDSSDNGNNTGDNQ